MYICLCKGITDNQIKEAVTNGAHSIRQVRKELGVASQCCKCLPDARAIIDKQLTTLEHQECLNTAISTAAFYAV